MLILCGTWVCGKEGSGRKSQSRQSSGYLEGWTRKDCRTLSSTLPLVEFSTGSLEQASFNQNRLPFTVPHKSVSELMNTSLPEH